MRVDDKLRSMILPLTASEQDHRKAYEVLESFHKAGKLPPVEDGTGNPLTDYVNILGVKK